MALPTVEKSWQRVFNIDSGTDRRQITIDRAKALCGLASFGGQLMTQNLWTPVKCCNSVSVVNGFNWNSVADIVTSNGAHSWLVLQNALGRQWLWDHRGTDVTQFFMTMSPGGLFTGGTTTAAPTATDGLDKDPSHASWALYDTSVAPRMLQNIWLSADGKQTMIVGVHNSTNMSLFLFGDLEDPPADWTHPTIMWGDNVQEFSSSTFFGNHLLGFSGGIHISGETTPGVSGQIHFIGEAVNSSPITVSGSLLNLKNELSNQWDIFDKCWLAGTPEASWGQLGYWPDLWLTMTTQTGYATTDHFPADGSRQFVKISDLIFPWFGAAAMVKV